MKPFFSLLSVVVFFKRCLFSKRSHAVIRRVSTICLLGLVVSIASLIVIFNVMGGLGESIREQFLEEEPHLVITWNNDFSHPLAIEKQKKIIQTIFKKNNLQSGIEDFYFFETVDLIIQTTSEEGRESFSAALGRGYDLEHLKKITSDLQPTVQNLPNGWIKSHSPVLSRSITMSINLAGDLNVYEGEVVRLIPAENLLFPPGEMMNFESARVKIAGSFSGQSWNANIIFYNKNEFPFFAKNSSYSSGFEIRLKEPKNYLLYQKILEDNQFFVSAWTERNSSVFFALKVEQTVMSLFLSLAGLMTLLAVSSLLVLLIVQKQKEIGALMALGFSIQKIRTLFTGMGMMLCTLGIGGGISLGLLVCAFIHYLPPVFLSSFVPKNGLFPIKLNFTFLIGFSISTLLLSFLICWISVQTQLNRNPSELLKNYQ